MVRTVRTVWALGSLVLVSTAASAAVSIVPAPHTELLYSTSTSVDCTKLHAIADSTKLPFNIVRLQAQIDGATPDPSVRLQWSFKGKAFGALAADEDLGPTGNIPSVTAMCANFGDQCMLTSDQLSKYDRDTILYVAPTCGELPRDPSKPFKGGTVRIAVRAFSGRRKLGKATTTLGFGHEGSTTVFVSRFPDGKFEDGIGRTAVVTYVNPIYAATVVQPQGVPNPPTKYSVSGGLGAFDMEPGCSLDNFAACQQFEQSGRKGIMTLATIFEQEIEVDHDQNTFESALCDNISIVVALCNPEAKLEVIPSPKRSVYEPASAARSLVNLRVRLHNVSKPAHGLPACPFILEGPNIATCTSALKIGKFTDTQSTSFSLPHCSKTTTQSCAFDGQCTPPACASCEAGERCLVGPYCSTTVARDCTSDVDCRPPACPGCDMNEICVHMLNFPSGAEIDLAPGRSIDLVTGTAELRNKFKMPAMLTDTWTVNVHIPSLTVTKTLKYRIKGER